MTRNPLISVVMPTHNSAQFVADAVRSVLAQTYSPVELIVVDDGSTDETLKVLEPFRTRIKCVRQPNRGPSAARNRGIRESRGELIAFLDSDDQWLPEKLARQWEIMQANPRVGLVHTGNLVLQQGSGKICEPLRDCGKPSGDLSKSIFLANPIVTSTVLVRRACLDHDHCFDENLRTCEDYDLWIRLASVVEFAYVDVALAIYRCHTHNTSRNEWVMTRDEVFVLHKQLRANPLLPKRLGWLKVRRRLADAYFAFGYTCHECHAYAEANRAFRRSLTYAPWRAYTFGLWLATLLPVNVVRYLRSLKRRLQGNGRRHHARVSVPHLTKDGWPFPDVDGGQAPYAKPAVILGNPPPNPRLSSR